MAGLPRKNHHRVDVEAAQIAPVGALSDKGDVRLEGIASETVLGLPLVHREGLDVVPFGNLRGEDNLHGPIATNHICGSGNFTEELALQRPAGREICEHKYLKQAPWQTVLKPVAAALRRRLHGKRETQQKTETTFSNDNLI